MNKKRTLTQGLRNAAILTAGALVLMADAPKGWFLAGDHPQNYETGVDAQTSYEGRPSAYLKYTGSEAKGFGTLMQSFQADQYAGKRVRFSAEVKAEGVQEWAGLWMRVDKGTKAVSFDNMQDRAIKGTGGWQHYAVVLDVPADATGIAFGILLSKTGEVWINGANFEVVESNVPVTKEGSGVNTSPSNLGFEK